jgi:hypothetical protein
LSERHGHKRPDCAVLVTPRYGRRRCLRSGQRLRGVLATALAFSIATTGAMAVQWRPLSCGKTIGYETSAKMALHNGVQNLQLTSSAGNGGCDTLNSRPWSRREISFYFFKPASRAFSLSAAPETARVVGAGRELMPRLRPERARRRLSPPAASGALLARG